MAERKTAMHTLLWKRKEELGLDNYELAGRADVDREMVEDVLFDDIDLEVGWSMGEVKRVLGVLKLNFLDVFGIDCAYCDKDAEGLYELASLPRNELIRRRREELGLSKEDFLTRVGWTEDEGIEDSPDGIDKLPWVAVQHVNNALGLPLQLLVGVKCGKCGK